MKPLLRVKYSLDNWGNPSDFQLRNVRIVESPMSRTSLPHKCKSANDVESSVSPTYKSYSSSPPPSPRLHPELPPPPEMLSPTEMLSPPLSPPTSPSCSPILTALPQPLQSADFPARRTHRDERNTASNLGDLTFQNLTTACVL